MGYYDDSYNISYRCRTPPYATPAPTQLSRPTQQEHEESLMDGFHFFWKVIVPSAIIIYLMVTLPLVLVH